MSRQFGTDQFLFHGTTAFGNFTGAMLVGGWFFLTSTVPQRLVTHWGDTPAERQWLLEYKNNRFEFVRYSGASFRGAQSLNHTVTNRWYHVAASYDGTNTKIAVDGVIEGTNTTSLTAQSVTARVALGGDGDYVAPFAGKVWFFGQMEHVVLYGGVASTTLRDNEIRAMHRNYQPHRSLGTGTLLPLVAWWPLWGEHDPEHDNSGKMANLVVSGAAKGTRGAPVRRRWLGSRSNDLINTGGWATTEDLGDYFLVM